MKLTEGFNLLATAPDGIKCLRELILSLAVQGKLVPQDASDEPASELLKQIRAEKDRLILDGKIKKDKPLPAIGDEEKPFELPAGWEWAHFGAIGQIGSSSRVHQSDWKSEGVPFYRAREIVKLSQNGHVDNDLFISNELFAQLSTSGFTPEPFDVMLTGVGTIGVPYVVQQSDKFYFKDASVLIFKNYAKLNSAYISLFCRCPYWIEKIHSESMGTTVHTLTIGRAIEVLVPLPPLAEQSRIVAKVEELMALCDALEMCGQLEAEQHARLTATLFDALAASESAHQLQENWARLAASFDLVLDRPQAVDALEQTLLQLAVRGLLVPQDPADEPASELLKQIRTEKDRLIAEGKIKKDKPLPAISDEEKPFELPQGWEWVRVGNAGVTQTGGTPASNRTEFFDGNFPFIGPGQITQDGKILSAEKFISTLGRFESATAEIGDILMVCIGGSIGKCASATFETAFNQQINSIHPLISSNAYILTAMSTLDFATSVRSAATGSATPIISKGKWDLLLLPMPPLAEQSRIVARVEALRALCGQLRQQLAASRQTQAHLAEALVAQT